MKKIYVYFYQEGDYSPSGDPLEVGRCYGYSEQQYDGSFKVDNPSESILNNIKDYKIVDGMLVHAPLPVELTEKELQNDFNIDIDYRVSCVELGI